MSNTKYKQIGHRLDSPLMNLKNKMLHTVRDRTDINAINQVSKIVDDYIDLNVSINVVFNVEWTLKP